MPPASLTSVLFAWHHAHFCEPPSFKCPIVVAYSGGADSTALLHIARTAWPGAVQAVHVHHGLQSDADDFARCCEGVCASWGVPLQVKFNKVICPPGSSLEECARRSRYETLAEVAKQLNAQVVLLAHHADDQAETVLFALSRGAGVKGLAGMGELATKNEMLFGRPFLKLSGSVLRACVEELGVAFVEDPTNSDVRFIRNKIRHQISPHLLKAFPHWVKTVARSARNASQAAALLDDLGRIDLQVVGDPPRIESLHQLSHGRQSNVLRYWLNANSGSIPSEAQLLELIRQIACCKTRAHQIDLKVGVGKVRRCGAVLKFSAA